MKNFFALLLAIAAPLAATTIKAHPDRIEWDGPPDIIYQIEKAPGPAGPWRPHASVAGLSMPIDGPGFYRLHFRRPPAAPGFMVAEEGATFAFKSNATPVLNFAAECFSAMGLDQIRAGPEQTNDWDFLPGGSGDTFDAVPSHAYIFVGGEMSVPMVNDGCRLLIIDGCPAPERWFDALLAEDGTAVGFRMLGGADLTAAQAAARIEFLVAIFEIDRLGTGQPARSVGAALELMYFKYPGMRSQIVTRGSLAATAAQ